MEVPSSPLAVSRPLSHPAPVRKWLFIAGTALLLALIGLIVWQANRVMEPRYKGKPLSFWLAGDGCSADETRQAVEHLGTNCIPTLLRMLQAEDSKAKKKLTEWAGEENISIDMSDADDAHRDAIRAFEILGTRAQGAVGDLIKMYERSPLVQQCDVVIALGDIGASAKEAIPTLLHAMTGTNDTMRDLAGEALGQIGQERDLVVPVMTKALRDPNLSSRRAAAVCLAYYGTNAVSAIPALIATARDPISSIRSEVMIALMRTRGEPELVVPVLTNALTDTDRMVRRNAALALAAYGTNAGSAIPVLAAVAADTNYIVRWAAISALGQIHLKPDLSMPQLTMALDDRNERARVSAAWALGKFGNEATSAVPALIELFHREQTQMPEHDTFKPQAMKIIREALLKIDPAAAAQAGITTNPPAL